MGKFFRSVSWLVLLSLANSAMASSVDSLLESKGSGGGADFYVGGSPGVNITVNVLGGVRSPGVYHLPENTDILTLVGYAGGPTVDAKLGDVTVRRRDRDGYRSLDIDVKDLISSADKTTPRVANGDVVYIPESHVATNTTVILGIVSTILTIGLAGYAVSQIGKSK